MGKGLSAPRMPPLLFPDASRDDPQKRSSRFSLYFHIDAFQFPIFPAPLRFPFIDNLHHTSYFVNQRIKSDVQRNSFRAASPPAKRLCYSMWLFPLHSAVKNRAFFPVFPLAGATVKAFFRLSPWSFRKKASTIFYNTASQKV